jgi:hypothetical protein
VGDGILYRPRSDCFGNKKNSPGHAGDFFFQPFVPVPDFTQELSFGFWFNH